MESLARSGATRPNFGSSYKLAREILNHLALFRRSFASHAVCDATCVSCQFSHLPKVIAAIRAARPVTFVLPAFPGKSPNLSKVLGPLPDLAEQLALQFLEKLCEQIKAIYPPGAHIVLCSDGRVFSDVVGMREKDVTDYQIVLGNMIADLSLSNLSTYTLDDAFLEKDFVRMRLQLLQDWGSSLDSLRARVLRGAKPHCHTDDLEANRMYCGILRFLVEDSMHPGQIKTRSAIQKECKAKAYEVIRRSNAWSNLIAEKFPEAVRLSIHPQTCASKKFGIRLIGTESWLTPWHGVAVKTDNAFKLFKRSEVEALGGQLIFSPLGRPSHFEL